jgi:type I restriction enzyme, S subunit
MSADVERGEWENETLPPSWCWVDFDTFWTDHTDTKRKLAQKLYAKAGPLAVVDQGADLIGGYTTDVSKRSLAPLPAIIFGDHTRIAKFIDHPFAQGADGVRVLCASQGIEPPFAYHALRCVKLPDKGYSRHFKFLKATLFPLAPLAEQRRIVAKIDGLSAKSKRALDQLHHIHRLAEKYKQAILVAAFSGELTRAWRTKAGLVDDQVTFGELPRELEDKLLPRIWTMKSVEQTTSNHDGKRIPVRAADRALRRGRFPYYGASGVIDTIDDYLFDGDFLLIGEDGANLLSRSTPIAFLASGRFWVNNHAHILQAGSHTSNNWLRWYINMIDLSPFVTGTAQPKLTQAALNKIKVPLPRIDEQQEILRRIETAFSWVDRVVTEVAKARKLIGHLDQALLAKAFQGELVPQDPADEPASLVLARISAQRSSTSPVARRSKSK